MKVIPLVNAGVLIDCDISKLTEQDYQDINEIYLDKINLLNIKKAIKQNNYF